MPLEAEAQAAYARACKADARGDEVAAIADYERSLALGLSRDDRAPALLGLGAALRAVGRIEDSVRVLRAAVDEFPDHAPLRAYLGLALYQQGDARQAMVSLLDLVLRHAPLGRHARQLGEFRDRLGRQPTGEDSFLELAESLTRHEFVHTFNFPFLVGIGPALQANDEFAEETVVGRRVEEVTADAATGAPEVLPIRKLNLLVPSAVTVGRASSNDLIIREPHVSKVHAFFRISGGRCELADAGSRNGTWIGNDRLEPRGAAQPVGTGDVITFGRTAFFFLDAGATWDRLRARRR